MLKHFSNQIKYLSFFLVIILLLNCKTQKNTDSNINQTKILEEVPKEKPTMTKVAGPRLIVYKTKNDYNNKVPVMLSDDKSKISSYPDIKDVFYKGNLALPTILKNGYLIDNRGINKNVAFTKYTYKEYSELNNTPNSNELYNSIIDNNPLIELFDCSFYLNSPNYVDEINNAILENKLKEKCNCL